MVVERLKRALVFKSEDVEEAADRYFHRPLAAVVTALLIPLPVTPNQVTLAGLATGWVGAYFLYTAFFVEAGQSTLAWVLAGGFLLLSVIFDCADGQLARATGGGSRVGRILDGFVDVLVLFPTYVILGFGIHEFFGTTWLAIAAVAGFSTWIHCIVYDKLKNLYLARVQPGAGGAQGSETVDEVRRELREATKEGSLLEQFLLWVYVGYLRIQERLASGSTDAEAAETSPEAIEAFRRRHRTTMRMASLLGLGTHMMIIYGGILLMAVDIRVALAMQLVFAIPFNAWMVVVLWRARRFGESVEDIA